MRARTLVVLLLLNFRTGVLAGAQSRARAFIDVTIGTGALVGSVPFNGAFYDETANPLLLLAFGHQPDVNRSLVAALHVGVFPGIFGGEAAWCRPTTLGGCVQHYPLAGIAALTVGGRPLTSAWRFVELTAGPAVVLQHAGAMSPAVLAVSRLGTPPGTWLSPGIAVHALATPVDGALIYAVGFGLNLRTW